MSYLPDIEFRKSIGNSNWHKNYMFIYLQVLQVDLVVLLLQHRPSVPKGIMQEIQTQVTKSRDRGK